MSAYAPRHSFACWLGRHILRMTTLRALSGTDGVCTDPRCPIYRDWLREQTAPRAGAAPKEEEASEHQ